MKFDEYQHSNTEGKMTFEESSKAWSSQSMSIQYIAVFVDTVPCKISGSSVLFSQESLVKMTPSKTNCFKLNDSNEHKVCQSNEQFLL
jgi:uncharacterized membrane protein